MDTEFPEEQTSGGLRQRDYWALVLARRRHDPVEMFVRESPQRRDEKIRLLLERLAARDEVAG